MPANRNRDRYLRGLITVGLLVSLGLATACSKKQLEELPAAIPSAEAAQSPPVTQAPAGTTRPLPGRPRSAVFDPRTGLLAILVSGPTGTAPASLLLMSEQQTSTRTIALPGAASGLTGDGAGTAYLSGRGGYYAADLATGRVTTVGVRGADGVDFSAITRRADGTVLLGTADGTLYAMKPQATDPSRIPLHAHVDSLAAQGNTVAVLDRGQTSITTVEADGEVGQALRAGLGATTIAADSAGRLLVSDTRGGQLLVFGVDPLILRQAYPVADSPCGVTGSRGLAWVSQTSANTVIGYDLSTGIPVEKVRYPSVRQPNALAFDDAAGTLFVLSDAGEGVQVIEHAADPR